MSESCRSLHEIKEVLDEYVIGQEQAKKFLRWRFITITNELRRW